MVERQLRNTHLSPVQDHIMHQPNRRPSESQNYTTSATNSYWRWNRQIQQFPPNFVVAKDNMWNDQSNKNYSPFVQGFDRRDYNGRYRKERHNRDCANQNWRGHREYRQSDRDNLNNSRSLCNQKSGSQGSSSGCSSSESVESRVILPIENEERKAVDIIREAAQLLKQEEIEYRRKSKALRRKIIPHYECLTGAMIRREQIQHESAKNNDGDRHAIDSHEVIFGHKKDEEVAAKERAILLAKWLLNNRVEDQVEYNADEDAEELQICEESKDDHGDTAILN